MPNYGSNIVPGSCRLNGINNVRICC